MPNVPLHSRALLFPRAIARSLERLRTRDLLAPADVPNLWQIQLGVLRMGHRVLFRSETIGQSAFPVRRTWRARLLERRLVRFPFLLRERAIHPLDFSGLASSPDRIHRHLLGAHHDGVQFLYDFQLLRMHDGDAGATLEAVRADARAIVEGSHPRAGWLRDLAVYERYHESLLEAVEAFLDGSFEAGGDVRGDPDIDFLAYLRFCARQPSTPAATLRALRQGRYSVAAGLTPPPAAGAPARSLTR